ncbi:stage 0 sporulation protein J [Anaeromassilibacillus sp. An172]|uniref:ParB/RepB/Spo0J family partition protein n=1 Tax=Anaeromassilibacillus sp. An172 TaxID=1965570 RepID=UPI000B392DF5|nr:ParB/RepB/Spo0J family partition protein [Anaeromassilibacillus sp. An172]OUP77911.1 stage 0 sporulation protein J [Anaeromassilibacillus sp. An172]
MAKKLGGLGKGLDAIFMENESESKNSTVTLKISEIEPNRDQPRKDFDESALAELAHSISQHGVLQPLLVRPLIGGGYQIVAGERRYRACRMAGVTEVPVVIRELSDSETMELALIENLQRENLTPIEEAKGFGVLVDEYGMSQEEVSQVVGRSRSAVANSLRLLNLPKEVSDMVERGEISAGHGRTLLALGSEEEMINAAKQIYEKELSVRQTEKLVKAINSEKDKSQKEDKQERISLKPSYFSEVELALTEYLGKKVTVTGSKNNEGGVLQIEFYSQDELKELANKLH